MNLSQAEVWGVIPCSGRSSRMGTTKAMLDAGGRTFIDRVIHALRAGGCSGVLVALPTLDGPEAAEAVEAGAQIVMNPSPEEGPIGSLRASLRVLDDSVQGVSFCPVDHPLIHEDTVRKLVHGFRQSQAPLVVPTYKGKRGHPVLFGRVLFAELLSDVIPEGARTVVHRHLDDTVSIPVDDEGTVIDIDDMTAYRRHYPEEYRLHLEGSGR
jgi:molybdenum cofactor cytidylyltransferase